AGAVAALEGAGFEERLLQRVELPALGEPLDGEDLFAGDGFDASEARADRLAVDQHRAGAAPAFAAAVFAAGQAKVVAEDAQEALTGLGPDRVPRTIDVKFLDRRHGSPPRGKAGGRDVSEPRSVVVTPESRGRQGDSGASSGSGTPRQRGVE